MKSTSLVLVLALLVPTAALAWIDPEAAQRDRPESPYFQVRGGERFPLKKTAARIQVTGPIANVVVTQEYANEGSGPIEATYVFPGTTRSAVHAVTMTVAGRVRRAKILEKQAARATYDRAKREGKSATLLEQERPNVFRMNVANVMPNETVVVELAYTELLVPRDGVYELVYPTVVGPRYEGQGSPEAGFGQAYHPPGVGASTRFKLTATLSSGTPVAGVESPSHTLKITSDDPAATRVELEPTDARDVILRWRLAGGGIAAGALAHEGPENTFLVTIEPPARVAEETIVPREFVFVVDTSGSMVGYPLTVAKGLVRELAAKMRPVDRLNVMTFAGGQLVMAPESVPATSENVERAMQVLSDQSAGGATELLPALRAALAMPHAAGCARSFLVITDGYVTCDDAAFRLVREKLTHANVFAFGIGTSVNRNLIEGLARAGRGEPFVVTGPSSAPEAAKAFGRYVERPLLAHVRVRAEGLDAYDLEPAEQPDLLADRPLTITGKWRGKRQGALVVTGDAGGRPWTARVDMAQVRTAAEHDALPLLWARERIAWLTDLKNAGAGPEAKQAILELGLKYGLLTEYTSFLAVDDVVRATTPAETVSQPLPLPAGVPQAATGAVVPTVPEPEPFALLVVAALAACWNVNRRSRA